MVLNFIYPFKFFCGLLLDMFEYAYVIRQHKGNIVLHLMIPDTNLLETLIWPLPNPFDDIKQTFSNDNEKVITIGPNGFGDFDIVIPTSSYPNPTHKFYFPKGILKARLDAFETFKVNYPLVVLNVYSRFMFLRYLNKIKEILPSEFILYPERSSYLSSYLSGYSIIFYHEISKNLKKHMYLIPTSCYFFDINHISYFNRFLLEYKYFNVPIETYFVKNDGYQYTERLSKPIECFFLENMYDYINNVLNHFKC